MYIDEGGSKYRTRLGGAIDQYLDVVKWQMSETESKLIKTIIGFNAVLFSPLFLPIHYDSSNFTISKQDKKHPSNF